MTPILPSVFRVAALLGICVPAAVLHGATLSALDSQGLAQDGTLLAAASGIHRIGSAATAGFGRNMLVVFQLPDFGAVSNPFTAATLSVNFANKSASPAYNVDLYGLAAQATSTFPTDVFYANATVDASSGVTLIQQDFAITTTSTGVLNTSGSALLDYLNAQYNGGAGANQYVVFRFNPDSSSLGMTAVGYNFSSVDNGSSPIPSITYSAVPEPAGGALLLLSGTWVMVRRRSRS